MYADDTFLLISTHNITSLSLSATEELQMVQQWFQANGLSLNTNKINFIRFNYLNRSHDHSLLVRSVHTSIEQVDAAKFLGIHIYSGLKWNIHDTGSNTPKKRTTRDAKMKPSLLAVA
nr:unnamed protein product [Callosobruchus analis]